MGTTAPALVRGRGNSTIWPAHEECGPRSGTPEHAGRELGHHFDDYARLPLIGGRSGVRLVSVKIFGEGYAAPPKIESISLLSGDSLDAEENSSKRVMHGFRMAMSTPLIWASCFPP
jgi:hypothetical protein